MRRVIVLLAAMCLVAGLPASATGAQPEATTRISGAGAAFVAQSDGHCYRMTITFLYDRYRDINPVETPPSYNAQVTLSIDEYDCRTGADIGMVEETIGQGFEEGDSYLINDLASAYVDIDWHAFPRPWSRHFHIWLGWVAYGTPTHVVDTQDPGKTIRQEVTAQLAGTVTDPSGLHWTYAEGSASMGIGTYIFAVAPDAE